MRAYQTRLPNRAIRRRAASTSFIRVLHRRTTFTRVVCLFNRKRHEYMESVFSRVSILWAPRSAWRAHTRLEAV